MSLDLHVYTEVNVGVFLPGGNRGVLHWDYIHAVRICTGTNGQRHAQPSIGSLSISGAFERLPLTLTVM